MHILIIPRISIRVTLKFLYVIASTYGGEFGGPRSIRTQCVGIKLAIARTGVVWMALLSRDTLRADQPIGGQAMLALRACCRKMRLKYSPVPVLVHCQSCPVQGFSTLRSSGNNVKQAAPMDCGCT